MSRVFVDDDGVWRGLSTEALADYERLAASTFFRDAMARGDIVGTERVDGESLPGEWAAVLRHDRIDVLSYPYEWPFEMLRDAALLQLSLTRAALTEKLITKDASPYNVQFVGTQAGLHRYRLVRAVARRRAVARLSPVLRVVPEPSARPGVARRAVPAVAPRQHPRDLPDIAAELLRGEGRFTKGVFTHVKLHARAERKYADADRERDVKSELQQAGFGPGLIDAQLKNLEKAITGLKWGKQDSTWSDYSDRSHYDDQDLRAKERFVAAAVEARPPGRVLDLGANDGHFSRLALQAGAASVVAVDSDDLVVDRLYRDLRREGERRVLPLVLDLSDPSPGLGWRSRERLPFVERVRPDLVLCLAVVHHLALTNTVPLDEIVAFLAEFGAPLVVEFPHDDDVMASRLLARKRAGVFDAYNRANWERALQSRFTVLTSETLPGGTRTLYHCEVSA